MQTVLERDVLVPEIAMPDVQSEMQEAQRLMAADVLVADETSHVTAVAVIKQADEYIKRIDDKFARIKGPLGEAVKSLNALIKELKGPAETVRETLRKRCLEWKLAEDKRIREEEARLLEEAQRKAAEWSPLDDEPRPEAVPPSNLIYCQAAGRATRYSTASGTRKTPWKARVTNIDALWEAAIKDPRYREYFIPDLKALDAKAKSMGSMMNIPGVESYQDQTLVIR